MQKGINRPHELFLVSPIEKGSMELLAKLKRHVHAPIILRIKDSLGPLLGPEIPDEDMKGSGIPGLIFWDC
jgi:hypothetical protein